MTINQDELRFVRETSWQEVIEVWRAREEEVWRPHYEARGFSTWLEWRMYYNRDFALETRPWQVYEVIDPSQTIPKCLVGAYHGWRRYYPEGLEVATFAQVAAHPTLRDNPTVQKVMADFPAERQMIAFRSGDKIVIRDGTHQSASIALAVRLGLPVTGRLALAITEFKPEEAGLFEQTYDQRFAPQPTPEKLRG